MAEDIADESVQRREIRGPEGLLGTPRLTAPSGLRHVLLDGRRFHDEVRIAGHQTQQREQFAQPGGHCRRGPVRLLVDLPQQSDRLREGPHVHVVRADRAQGRAQQVAPRLAQVLVPAQPVERGPEVLDHRVQAGLLAALRSHEVDHRPDSREVAPQLLPDPCPGLREQIGQPPQRLAAHEVQRVLRLRRPHRLRQRAQRAHRRLGQLPGPKPGEGFEADRCAGRRFRGDRGGQRTQPCRFLRRVIPHGPGAAPGRGRQDDPVHGACRVVRCERVECAAVTAEAFQRPVRGVVGGQAAEAVREGDGSVQVGGQAGQAVVEGQLLRQREDPVEQRVHLTGPVAFLPAL